MPMPIGINEPGTIHRLSCRALTVVMFISRRMILTNRSMRFLFFLPPNLAYDAEMMQFVRSVLISPALGGV